jgi:hypothetical protein
MRPVRPVRPYLGVAIMLERPRSPWAARKARYRDRSVGDHCHERMTVKAQPGSALEVIETNSSFNCW